MAGWLPASLARWRTHLPDAVTCRLNAIASLSTGSNIKAAARLAAIGTSLPRPA